MIKTKKLFSAFLILIFLVGCEQKPTTTPTQPVVETPPTIGHLVISEIMAGDEGINNLDLIDFYNPSQQ